MFNAENFLKNALFVGLTLSLCAAVVFILIDVIEPKASDQARQSAPCGQYCENYPDGFSQVRLRDWRE